MSGQPGAQPALTFEYPALEDASDGAQAAFNVHLQQYSAELATRARRKAQHELVVRADVDGAAKELQPTSTRDRLKIAADWTKRSGFLFVGLAVSQAVNISDQTAIAMGSVWWLVGDAVVAAGCIVAGYFLDQLSLR